MSTGLRSGELAAAAGVNLQTLRYYERRGLLAEPERSPGGHRLYPMQAVLLLRVIKTAQRLGFTPTQATDQMQRAGHVTINADLPHRCGAIVEQICPPPIEEAR
ncbi:MerR family transcriptional regulator [Catellatospora citrea]|uniref:MerR family transcriptional regulator n=1 Tax=Catellatospora citrea TaxID=53366 RepID=UPI003405297C